MKQSGILFAGKKLSKSMLLLTLGSVQLFALNIDEAVNEALKNNYDLQSQTYIYEQSQHAVDKNRAAFLPKLDLSYEYNERDKTIGTQLKKETTASAVVSYNLFNGFSDFNTINSAKFLEKSSAFTLKAVTQDIILNTKQAYITYLNRKKQLNTYEEAFKLFDKQYVDAKIKYDQGLLARNDLLQVHVNLLDAKQNVISAKKNLKVAQLNLSNIIGGKDLNNEGIEELKLIDFNTVSYEKALLENRSEIEALKMSIQSYKSLASAQKGSFMPSVDTSFSMSKYGDNASLSSVDGYPNHQETATISASWNLYNGGSNLAQMKTYLAQKKELHATLQKTILDINLQYEQALLEFDVAKQNFQTAKLGLEQAKENYSLVNNRFKEGLSSTTDLIDANYLLMQAKQRYYQSYYDKFLSVATLNRIVEARK